MDFIAWFIIIIKKYHKLYDSNREKCTKINYQIGYLLEKANKINFVSYPRPKLSCLK